MSYEENPSARNDGAPAYGAGNVGGGYTGGPGAPPPPYPPPPYPPPPPPGTPNPGLAALLGFIPGVGAMYNGQFAKGIAHLAIFAVLVSLADSHGIFGLFVAGWVIYQVFEAHQTARARRDGTPLPNPFGLNDLGERMGFGKGWSRSPANPNAPIDPNAPPAAAAAGWDWQRGWQDVQQDVQQTWQQKPWQQQQPWSAPPQGPAAGSYPPYAPPPPAGGYQPPYTPYAPPAGYAPPPPPPGYGPTDAYGTYGMPPMQPGVDPVAPRGGGFPAGAIWLIGLGLVLLLTQTHMMGGFHAHLLWPFIMIGLGIWIFLQRSGMGVMRNDGSAAYRWNLLRAVRRSGFLILLGVLGLVSGVHWLRWGSLWPFILIYFGVFAIAERTAANQMAAENFARSPAAGPWPQPEPPSTAPSPAPSTSIVPTQHQNDTEEGR